MFHCRITGGFGIMTRLEFPYRLSTRVALGFFLFFAICLTALAYLGTTERDFWSVLLSGRRGGTVAVAIAAGSVFLALFPILWLIGRLQNNVIRLTDRELILDFRRGAQTIALTDIRNIQILGSGAYRAMVIEGCGGRKASISQTLLPSREAFDELRRALMSSGAERMRAQSPGKQIGV
jgi:hypothetical protein